MNTPTPQGELREFIEKNEIQWFESFPGEEIPGRINDYSGSRISLPAAQFFGMGKVIVIPEKQLLKFLEAHTARVVIRVLEEAQIEYNGKPGMFLVWSQEKIDEIRFCYGEGNQETTNKDV